MPPCARGLGDDADPFGRVVQVASDVGRHHLRGSYETRGPARGLGEGAVVEAPVEWVAPGDPVEGEVMDGSDAGDARTERHGEVRAVVDVHIGFRHETGEAQLLPGGPAGRTAHGRDDVGVVVGGRDQELDVVAAFERGGQFEGVDARAGRLRGHGAGVEQNTRTMPGHVAKW